MLAAKDAEHGGENERQALISETADLWFHSLVMLSHLEMDHQAVLDELARRFGISGHDEKPLVSHNSYITILSAYSGNICNDSICINNES